MKACMDWALDTAKDWFESGAAFIALLWLTLLTVVAMLTTVIILYWTSRGPWDAAHVKAEQDENAARLQKIYRAVQGGQ